MALTPVIIGVADVVNRSTKVEDAREPLDLIVEAIQNSVKDSGIFAHDAKKLQSSIDSIDVVASWTWPYSDLAESIANKLGIKPGHKNYTPHGGNQSGKIFDDAARRISQGKSKVAVCTGGEALASCGFSGHCKPESIANAADSDCICCGWQTPTSWLGEAISECSKCILTDYSGAIEQYVLHSRHCGWNEQVKLIWSCRSWCYPRDRCSDTSISTIREWL